MANRNTLIEQFCKPAKKGDDAPIDITVEALFSISPSRDSLNTEEKYIYQGLIKPDTEDPVRKKTANEWYYTGPISDTEDGRLNLRKTKILKIEEDENTFSINTKELKKQAKELDLAINVEDLVGQTTQEIKEEIDINNNFYYLVLSHDRPYVQTIDSSARQPFSVTTKNNYRFYDKKYELSNNNVPTPVLPNYYIIKEDNFSRTQGGGLEYINSEIASYNNTVVPSKKQLIEEFSSIPFDSDVSSYISTKMENVLFPSTKVVNYSEYNEDYSFQEIFPYSILLEFDTDTMGYIANQIKESSLTDSFLAHIFDMEQQAEKRLFTIKGNNSPLRKREEVEIIELDTLIEKAIEDTYPEFDNLCYLNDIDSQIEPASFLQNEEQFHNENTLSFENMIDGLSCYSETLFYKVDKYELDQQGEEKVQSFYLSNTDEISKVSIVDTQVKYGKKYRYEIFSYKYAIANSYSYEYDEDKFSTNNKPTPVIVKMLFASAEEVVLDKPAAPPEVDIISYKDNSEQISFFFNPSTLQYKMKEVSFTQEERERYSLIRDSQNISEDELITFGGDDKIEKYHIYRIEKQPSSYEDFIDSLYAISLTEKGCVTAEYLDMGIEPNKEYYYIFRAVDIHNNISPPTAVWKIELVNEDGTVFLYSKTVPFKENKFQKEEKSVKKYIHIKPSLIQSLLDQETIQPEEEEGALDILPRAVLGTGDLEETVWNKRFKMRIKSKSTNRSIDVKFKFTSEKEEKNA